ncbi:MAG: FAD:protein FMN transferase [Planctomycetes bacterium]|nr:FAD:protein FMN transferase [Planctomycetota bacterium]MCH9727377.1 FAD:protein FMN transferase [Planctomycetota bacterium]MCH9777999.1 FAD:protein FMN transferase [Planctomycetota bacterium]MCH9792266.1 FAD:protein FMN transferase [Planctomycetota bacterium]MDF1744070.1 FAD:protein FMN transferase [Gimesia sp.]
MSEKNTNSNRREFLTGRVLKNAIEQTGENLADYLGDATEEFAAPAGGSNVRLSTRAMATEFAVVMNPGPSQQVTQASDALDLLHNLEQLMTVYRSDSAMSLVNAQAAERPVTVDSQLFDILDLARQICLETEGGFDPSAGPLIALWRECRQQGRIPSQQEIDVCLTLTGIEQFQFDPEAKTIQYRTPENELNLGGIGKGYALDVAGEFLTEQELESWLFYGGFSSILAKGTHNQLPGWPVGIKNPLFTSQRLGTILLQNNALSSSGSSVQHFRHQGKRYGHILDPRTGWPVAELLSVTVIAPTAALADALSTAFYVIGIEKALEYCDNHSNVGTILIPAPTQGRKLSPVIRGIPNEFLFLDRDQLLSQ